MRNQIYMIIAIMVTACSTQTKSTKPDFDIATVSIDASITEENPHSIFVSYPKFRIQIVKYPKCTDGYRRLGRFLDAYITDGIDDRRIWGKDSSTITIPSGSKLVIHSSYYDDGFIANFPFNSLPICGKYITFIPSRNHNYILKLNYDLESPEDCEKHEIEIFISGGDELLPEPSANYLKGNEFFAEGGYLYGMKFKCSSEENID